MRMSIGGKKEKEICRDLPTIFGGPTGTDCGNYEAPGKGKKRKHKQQNVKK